MADGVPARRLAVAAAERLRVGARLHAAAHDETLVVTGEPDDLPWSDGVTYLGAEDGLLLPTLSTPTLPADLLRRAAARRLGPGPAGRRIVVVPGRILAFAPTPSTADPDWLADWALAEVRP
jgi:hypothetical protein